MDDSVEREREKERERRDRERERQRESLTQQAILNNL